MLTLARDVVVLGMLGLGRRLNLAAVGEADMVRVCVDPGIGIGNGIGTPTMLLRALGAALRGLSSTTLVLGSRRTWSAVSAMNASLPALCILHVRSGSMPHVRRRFVSESVDPGCRG